MEPSLSFQILGRGQEAERFQDAQREESCPSSLSEVLSSGGFGGGVSLDFKGVTSSCLALSSSLAEGKTNSRLLLECSTLPKVTFNTWSDFAINKCTCCKHIAKRRRGKRKKRGDVERPGNHFYCQDIGMGQVCRKPKLN